MVDDIPKIKKQLAQQATQLEKFSQRLSVIEQAMDIQTAYTPPVVEEKRETKKSAKNHVENPTSMFKIFGVIGAAMIILGVVYFYKYAVDQGWIGVTGRIALGILAALAFIVVGVFMHKKEYVNYSQVLNSIGLGVLYFTLFATYHFDEYRNALNMNLTLNTILLLSVMIGGLFLGMNLNAKVVIYGSMLLGFIAAFLSGIDGNTLHILIYVLLVDIVVLILAKMRSWYMGVPAQILTYIAFGIWFAQAYASPRSIMNQTSSPVLVTFSFLLLYYAVFTILSFVQSSQHKETECSALSVINTFCLTSFGLSIIYKYYPDFNGLFVMAVAALVLFIGFLSKKYDFKKIFDIHFLMTCILVAIAIPVQFDKSIVTVLWVLMALGLAYAGLNIKNKSLFMVGYIGFIIPFTRALCYDLWFLGNVERFIALAAVIGGMITIQLIMLKFKDAVVGFELLNVGWVSLAVIWIAREVFEHASHRMANVTLSIAWALAAVCLIAYGILNKRKIFNWLGVVLFGIVIIKVLIMDLSSMENILRVFALVIVGALALVGSFLFVKNKEKIKEFM